jgi:hypothetical protein
VTQVGCAGASTCDTSTEAKHTFSYFDDVEPRAARFADAVKWDAAS